MAIDEAAVLIYECALCEASLRPGSVGNWVCVGLEKHHDGRPGALMP